MTSLGTIRGQMILDVRQALASYTSVRQANVSTVTALNTGAGAMARSGAAIAGVGAIMVGGFLTAVDAAAQFEKKLDYFVAVGGPDAAKMYDQVKEKALQLGADTIYSADQIAESFIELGKSGVSAQDIINGIGEGVASLGAAADIPLDTAANIITSAVATFQLGADQAVMVADKLAGAANASIIGVEDLGTSLKYVGGVASSLGVPFQDVNTALALLGENGIKGSTAGTSLRQILLGLGGSTDKARTALTELGIITEDGGNKFFTAEGKAKSLSEIFQVLQDATAGMSDKQKTATMQQIFAVRALPSLIALTRGGADAFAEMAAEIDKTTALEVAGARLDNLAGDIEILKGNLDTLFISGGGGFQEFSRSIVQGITDMVQSFLDLPASTQTTIFSILGVGGAILVAIGSMGIFAGAILNIISLAITLAPAITAVVGVLRAFSIVQTAIAVASGVATAAQWLWNAAMTANPIGIIIVAIAALVAGLIWFFTQTELGQQIWTEFTRFLTEAWTNIVAVATTIWEGLVSFFTGLWNNLVSFFQTWGPLILTLLAPFIMLPIMIVENWDSIVAFFQTIWSNITSFFTEAVSNIVGFFTAMPGQIAGFFNELPGRIGYAIGLILGIVTRIFATIGVWLITNVPIIVNNVVTFFQELPTKIGQFFQDIWNNAVQWFTQLSIDATILAIQIVTGIIGWIQQLPGMIITFFAEVYINVVTWLTNAWNQAISIASSIVTGIIGYIAALPMMIQNYFMEIVSKVVTFFTQAYDKAIEIGSNIYTGISDAINGLPGLVTGIFENVVQAVKDAISGAVAAVTDFASGLWEGFKDGLGIHSPSYIEHAMWAITAVLDDETQHMKRQVRTIQGLGNGISAMGENMGWNFGKQLDEDLISLQEQLAASKSFQTQFGLNATGTGASAQESKLGEIASTLKGIKDMGGTTYGDIIVKNPLAERASDSLPKTIRKMAYTNG